jgi:hypothetical protein
MKARATLLMEIDRVDVEIQVGYQMGIRVSVLLHRVPALFTADVCHC